MNNIVISSNPEPGIEEFKILLSNTTGFLAQDSTKKQDVYLDLLGNKLERKVYDILVEYSRGTAFEGSIELISGQKFPDIIARKYYGVEVKSTKSNKWKSTGSSIAEGTRVDGVERIYMLFGKMSPPIQFICKPYQECLSEVVVTHSPRYLIDMELSPGETIFDKINIGYDVLRKQENPIKTILDYYKQKLKQGDDFWWMDNASNSLIIRVWNNLTVAERDEFMLKGFCYFPELVSTRIDIFNKYAVWLSIRQGIVCPNVRDIFSAGGQGTKTFESLVYSGIPRIIVKLLDNISKIRNYLIEADTAELEEYWGCKIGISNRFDIWIDIIEQNCKQTIKNKLPLRKILEEKMK